VPIIKFMSYLTSHMYLMFLLMLVGITPIYPVVRPNLVPYWYEWTLLVWLSGLLLFELTNPSDKSGLGWVKLAVLLFGIFGVALHLLGLSGLIDKSNWGIWVWVPIIKFMSYLTSHMYLMFLLMLVGITPIYPVVRPNLVPYWYEWTLLVWLSGLLLFELTNPSDKSGLGWVKLAVLLFGIFGVALHLLGLSGLIDKSNWGTLMYLRNQMFAISFLLACVQILDFLSFHHLFGPWAIIIGDLMKDLARFLAVLGIFVFGFSMHIVALNQPFKQDWYPEKNYGDPELFSEVTMMPWKAFELLFFAIFGQTDTASLQVHKIKPEQIRCPVIPTVPLLSTTAVAPLGSAKEVTTNMTTTTTPAPIFEPGQPEWTEKMFVVAFGIYQIVAVIVLINLLIAMMSDTYQRIQAQSDIEWKYGLAKLIRNMHRTTTTPSPLNLVTSWLMYLIQLCRQKMNQSNKRPSLVRLMGLQSKSRSSARTKMGAKWLSKVKKGQVAPKESVTLSVMHLSPLGSQLSFTNAATRIENIADWEAIAKRYRALMGELEEHHRDNGTDDSTSIATSSIFLSVPFVSRPWLSKKGQVAPKESVTLSVMHLSPLGSQLSFTNAATRIENIADWEAIAKRYRALMGELEEHHRDNGTDDSTSIATSSVIVTKSNNYSNNIGA
ncbi:uncharacterized protein LOC103518553, partial [Diaphorina citri]|uniref:Uncharacterized protein LOC103518553 n=1 Tax=Diaphorina citri TaxID=121845 RepID=A0A3Q0JHA9_DIACI